MDNFRKRFHNVGNKINTVVAYLSALQEAIESVKGLSAEESQELLKKCQIMEKNLFELEEQVTRIKSLSYRFVDPNKDLTNLADKIAVDNRDISILVVDDEEDLCDLLKETVGRLGYKVDSASTPEEANKAIIDNTPNIVLLDLYMQEGMEGLEILRFIRKERPWVKCLVITWEYNEDVLRLVREFRPEEIMVKPVTSGQLKAKINGLVASLENRE